MIRRAPNRERWVTVDNRAVEDARLSLKAKGLLLYILSRPDHWHVMPQQLATTTTDGVTTVRSCLRELRKFGYATLEKIGSGGRGKLGGSEWVIHELPFDIATLRDSMITNLENSTHIVSTELKVSTDKKEKKGVSLVKPTASELRSYAESIGYNDIDPQEFLAHYESNGWMVGRVKMKSWQATVVTWKKRHGSFGGNKAKSMPYKTRQEKINELNRRKQALIRENAPYHRIHEIDMRLMDL